MTEPPPQTDLQRSTRDLGQVRAGLERWLPTRLPAGADPHVAELAATSANGMSSETLLFDASWTTDGAVTSHALVARVAPDPRDIPVFPSYDLAGQCELIRRVGEASEVPVPKVWWSEDDPRVIGAPFFVMGRVDGRVPPDVMPYSFGDNWLFDAAPEDQRRLQDGTVEVLAALHAIDRPEARFGDVVFREPGDTALRQHVEHARKWYEFAAADGVRCELVEQGFRWLDDHWPAEEGETVLSWGDSRVGNVIYDGFSPAAVLDWEMAGLGPRELDIAWLVYSHRVFDDLATGYGLPGMPTFLRIEDVATTYERVSGQPLRNVEFFLVYSAVQWAVVGLRTGTRSVHFGERPMPETPEELLHNRVSLEALVRGSSDR